MTGPYDYPTCAHADNSHAFVRTKFAQLSYSQGVPHPQLDEPTGGGASVPPLNFMPPAKCGASASFVAAHMPCVCTPNYGRGFRSFVRGARLQGSRNDKPI